MIRALLALLLLAGSTAAPARSPDVAVAVTRSGDSWTADYRFTRRSAAWLFPRSSLTRIGERPWRPGSWTVETPGVRLERHGRYDVLAGAAGRPLPATLRIRFTPFAGDLQADYDPALTFTDGSVALYSAQFGLLPIASAGEADRLPADLNTVELPAAVTRVSFRDRNGRVLIAGRRVGTATVEDEGDGTYVLFGPLRPIATEAMTAIIDPALPEWIRDALGRSVPGILGRYAAALGPANGPKPTVMVSWAGPTKGVTSMGGSVLQGQVVMTYEGEGVVVENDQARDSGLWFIAHESAHFWLGNTVRYEYARDAWITEGGADLLAFRTVAAVSPGYDWRAQLNTSIADCASLTLNRGVASAEDRGEHRAYYACGAVFGMVAEAASKRPFIDFVRGLIAANRADGVVTRGEWLAALDKASGDPSLSRQIGVLLDRGSTDPKAAIAALLKQAGISFRLDAQGLPVLT